MNSARTPLLPALLLATALTPALGGGAHAARVLFTGGAPLQVGGASVTPEQSELQAGSTVGIAEGVLQIELDDGGTLSLVGPAELVVGEDGTIEVVSGGVTIVGGPNGSQVRMPGGATLVVEGAGTFTVTDGQFDGRVVDGSVSVGGEGGATFEAGDSFVVVGGAAQLTFSSTATWTPGQLQIGGGGEEEDTDGNPEIEAIPSGPNQTQLAEYLQDANLFTGSQNEQFIQQLNGADSGQEEPGGGDGDPDNTPPDNTPPDNNPPDNNPPDPGGPDGALDPDPAKPAYAITGTDNGNFIIAYAGDTIGIDLRDNTTVTADASGQINKYVWDTNPTGEAPERGSNEAYEAGTAGGGVIMWTRWAYGTTGGEYFGNAQVTRNNRQGLHMVAGAAPAVLPSAGEGTYTLVGATAPTIGDGSLEPGTFTGSLGVVFGVAPKVGFDLRPTIGGVTYIIATNGGSADPSLSLIDLELDGTFSSAPSGDVAIAPGGVCPSGCDAWVYGFLAGHTGDYAGLTYHFGPGGSGGAAEKVSGVAAFDQTSFDAGAGGHSPAPMSGGSISQALRISTQLNAMGGTMLFGPVQSFVSETDVSSQILTTNGVLTGFTATGGASGAWLRGTAVTGELAGNRYIQIGRWNGGTILRNGSTSITPHGWQGGVYLAGVRGGAGVLPTSGTATYTLAGSTGAMFVGGTYAPGVLTGTAAVAFSAGGNWKLGLSAQVATVENSANVVYNISTTGGAATPSTSEIGSGGANFYSIPIPTGSTVCAGSCEVMIRGSLVGGPQGRDAGVAYRIGNSSNVFGGSNAIAGAAWFQRDDLAVVMRQETGQSGFALGPNSGVVTGSFSTAFGNDVLTTYVDATGLDSGIESFRTTGLDTYAADTATIADAGATPGNTMAWSRWTNGTAASAFGGAPVLTANQGIHLLTGEPAANVPVSGTATYALAGATAPTIADGSVAPGTFTGSAAVAFNGTGTHKLGLDADVTIGGYTYDIVTTGGVANPAASTLAFNGAEMGAVYGQPRSLALAGEVGPACPTNACTAQITAFLSGNGATELGFGYAIGDGTNAKVVQGVAGFVIQ